MGAELPACDREETTLVLTKTDVGVDDGFAIGARADKFELARFVLLVADE